MSALWQTWLWWLDKVAVEVWDRYCLGREEETDGNNKSVITRKARAPEGVEGQEIKH